MKRWKIPHHCAILIQWLMFEFGRQVRDGKACGSSAVYILTLFNKNTRLIGDLLAQLFEGRILQESNPQIFETLINPVPMIPENWKKQFLTIIPNKLSLTNSCWDIEVNTLT